MWSFLAGFFFRSQSTLTFISTQQLFIVIIASCKVTTPEPKPRDYDVRRPAEIYRDVSTVLPYRRNQECNKNCPADDSHINTDLLYLEMACAYQKFKVSEPSRLGEEVVMCPSCHMLHPCIPFARLLGHPTRHPKPRQAGSR